MAKANTASRVRKKVRKTVSEGIVHVHAINLELHTIFSLIAFFLLVHDQLLKTNVISNYFGLFD